MKHSSNTTALNSTESNQGSKSVNSTNIVSVIKSVSFGLVFFIWMFLGLYICIPAILVSSIILPLAIVSSLFGGSGTTAISNFLQNSISMYRKGFEKIHDSVYKEQDSSDIQEFFRGLFVGILAFLAASLVWYLIVVFYIKLY